jgi:hypothetical protein
MQRLVETDIDSWFSGHWEQTGNEENRRPGTYTHQEKNILEAVLPIARLITALGAAALRLKF